MENQESLNGKSNNTVADIGSLVITYYTDPLCSWSWAFEPVWEQLLAEWGDRISYRYCMGGMLSSWNEYNDALRSVSRPQQMGPVWAEVKHTTGRHLDDKIWFKDPPASSYPACMAVKCAGQQSAAAGHAYLKNLRNAVMTERRNIARRDVLIEIAYETALEHPSFDAHLFVKQLTDPLVLLAFKDDLRETRMNNVVRFPSLLISGHGTKKRLMLTGYRPYEVLVQSLEKMTE